MCYLVRHVKWDSLFEQHQGRLRVSVEWSDVQQSTAIFGALQTGCPELFRQDLDDGRPTSFSCQQYRRSICNEFFGREIRSDQFFWLICIDYYLRYRICLDWRGACEDIWQCSRRRRQPQYAKQFAPRPEIDPTVIWPSTLISENNFCFCYVGGVDGTSLVVQNPQKFNVPTSGGRVKGDLHFGSESGFHLDIAVHIEQLFSHVHVAYFHGDVQR